MQTITPFLWFDDNLEEALALYTSAFPDSEVLEESRPTLGGPLFLATFRLRGQTVMGINGGPQYRFSPAFSFFVSCDTQAEVDTLWQQLGEGGEPLQCGWLTDRFGVTWQIVPSILGRLLGDPDRARAGRVQKAMMKMIKLDIAALQQAYDQE